MRLFSWNIQEARWVSFDPPRSFRKEANDLQYLMEIQGGKDSSWDSIED